VSDETASKRTMDYDPMVYDVLRDTATRLGGKYIARAYRALTADEDDRWMQMDLDLQREVRGVDIYDEHAVRSKTAELTERYRLVAAQEKPEWDRLSDDEQALARQIRAANARGDSAEVTRLRGQPTGVTERPDHG